MNVQSEFIDVIDLTRTLVNIPSVNPLLSDDPSNRGELRLARFLEAMLSARGMSTRLVEKTPGRPNLVATFRPDGPVLRRLIVEAHLDTQGIHGMTVPPFEGVLREGRLYGRGACDMKGPMAAALVNLTPARLQALAAVGVETTFIGAIGEETGNIGALELVGEGMGADEILVLEPTDLHIVHAHKGAFWLEIEARGRAAHGSNPSEGVSAVAAVGKIVAIVQGQVAGSGAHSPVLGRPTVNFGKIEGGTSINIVPERCLLQIDRRTVPGETSGQILAGIRSGMEQLVRAGDLTGFDLRVIKEGTPFETTPTSRLLARLSDACADEEVTPVVEGAAWYSDAGPFAATCREVAVFGPGSIKQAHTADEFIEVAELTRGARILGRFFDRMAGASFA